MKSHQETGKRMTRQTSFTKVFIYEESSGDEYDNNIANFIYQGIC